MGVASLVLGILGIVVFCWLGPVLGGAWAGALMASAALRSQPEIITWPLWVLGLAMGVGLPGLAVALGIGALARSDKKGVAIGGLVTGIVAAVIGLAITFVSVKGLELADNMINNDSKFQQQMEQLKDELNDPMLQKKFQERLQKAGGDDPNAPQPMSPDPEPASPTPADTAASSPQP